jgi:DNA invertase Pin-like site-specific DNA recombinase
MKRPDRFQPRQKKAQQSEWTNTELPLWAGVGVYARQSTQMQVKTATVSTEMQTDDLVDFARRLGWKDEQIIVFAQDLGRSGRLRIDEREGLRTLVAHIEAGSIKAVIVFLEDRLFRDETQIQVNTFISICKQFGVLVITPSMTYNFNNRYHVKEFRWKCEAAADYLTDYVMARLVGAKYKVSERGEYDGRALPPGYIIDRREWVELNGVRVKNNGYKRYMIYEPHAQIVRWLYHRYMILNGNLSRLCREIKAMPVLFPDFTTEVDSRNISRLELKRVEGGYHITRKGLISILTNVSYLGWWLHQGEVKIKDNHPAIIDEGLFWYAFNRLSDYTLEGVKNEHKKRYAPRYQRRAGVSMLLKNIIGTELLGSVYAVLGGPKHKQVWFYALHEKDVGLVVQYHSSILVSELDKIYVDKLLERLRQTTDFEHYRTYAEQERQSLEGERVSVQAQIDEIDRRCEGIMLSLQRPTLVGKLREDLEKTYEGLQQQRLELVNKLEAPQRSSRARELLEFQKLIDKLAPHWDSLVYEDRVMLVEALTERVLIDSMSPHWMRFIIQWRDPQWQSDTAYIWRRYGTSSAWSEEENEILRQGYGVSDRASLLAYLPTRSWSGITFQANLLGLHRSKLSVNNSPIPKNVTYSDWVFMQDHGIVYSESWGLIEAIWLS